MGRIRRWIAWLLCASIFFVCTACTKTDDVSVEQLPDALTHPASVVSGPADGKDEAAYTFGFLWGGESDYYEPMPAMFSRACEELQIPIPVDATPAHWIQEEQNQKLDELLADGIRGISMMPSEEYAGNEKIEELTRQGIPIVCIGGAPAQPSTCTLTLATDVYQCAYDATLALLEHIGYEGNIVAITGATTDTNSEKRLKGVADACLQYSHVTLVDKVAGITSEESALSIVGDLLEEWGDQTDGVVAMDYYAAYAMAYYLLRNQDYSHIACVGIDSDPLVLEAIREDKMIGSMSQNPWAQAYLSVYTLKMLIDGWSYRDGQPAIVDSGSFLITKDLVNDYEIKAIELTMELAETWADRFYPPASAATAVKEAAA